MFPNSLQLDGTQEAAKLGQALMEAFAKAGGAQFQKSTGAPQGPYLHGPGGFFGVRGLSQELISTHTQITGSLAELIPMSPNNDMNPLFPYITGFIGVGGQEKNAICDPAEEAGPMKTCIQTTVFGRKEQKTRELEINAMNRRINRGEFMDLTLANSPLVNSMGGLMRDMFGLSNQNAAIAGNEVAMRFIEVAIALQRWLCPQTFTGNPANSSAGGGYKEFMGLDLLIARNKVDAIAGTACPSLYSDIKSFNYRQVDSVADPDLVKTITTMMHILNRKAVQQNMAPVDIRMVMRSDLFYYITEIWPCRYITYRCDNADGANIDPVGSYEVSAAMQMKFDMRNGSYLWVDGKRVPVILDDCIPEDNQADNAAIPIGGFASDIYFVPFTARGGTLRTLYWEHFDYREAVTQVRQVNSGLRIPTWWSDSGAFLWTMLTPTVWCVDWQVKFEPRLILRTPQLAGRLTDVTYVPLQHTDDPLPTQDYHVNGGIRTGYPTPSPYYEANLSGPGFTA